LRKRWEKLLRGEGRDFELISIWRSSKQKQRNGAVGGKEKGAL